MKISITKWLEVKRLEKRFHKLEFEIKNLEFNIQKKKDRYNSLVFKADELESAICTKEKDFENLKEDVKTFLKVLNKQEEERVYGKI